MTGHPVSPTLATTLDARLEQAIAALRTLPAAAPPPVWVEPVLDAAYATASGDSVSLDALAMRFEASAGANQTMDAWRGLLRFARAEGNEVQAALSNADACIGAAAPWTRLVAGAEAARLVWGRTGAAAAWRLASRHWVALRAVLPPTGVQRDSPLLVSGACVLLDLAAVNGDWAAFGEIQAHASSLWTPPQPAATRIGLVIADGAVTAGRFVEALRQLEALEAGARGDLRVHLLCARLHALVALGRGREPETRAVLEAAFEAERARPSEPPFALPAADIQRLRLRLRQVASVVRELAEVDGVAIQPRDGSTLAEHLSDLLERERKGRERRQPEARARALFPVLADAEKLFFSGVATADPSESIQLRLLYCRLIVDLAQTEVFTAAERVLDDVSSESHRFGFAQLRMLALDQRAVLRARSDPADWQGAVLDSTAAAQIAMDLITQNASVGGAERPLLERLLPVIDRVIELHVEGAERVAQKHPEVLSEELGRIDPVLREAETAAGTWLRFGQTLHRFAEQAQALALAEARRAYDDPGMTARGFVVEQGESGAVPADAIAARLRTGDAVLQYLLVSRYVLVFTYARDFFDWSFQVVEGGDSAERALDQLIEEELRSWTQGGEGTAQRESLRRLERLVLPEKIAGVLRRRAPRHLRIVPHGALYRIPFQRLLSSRVWTFRRPSSSLHPTGQAAAESAEGRVRTVEPQPSLGHIIGPEPAGSGASLVHVGSAGPEDRALRRGVGRLPALATVTPVDGAAAALPEVLARLPEFGLLHFSCHGREGSALGVPPCLVLGTGEDAGLQPGAIAQLDLPRCALVVLQSCSTGWMNHRRASPVQGIPQAFLDAGARAVIAPLTKVPTALVATFSEVFYRALRFLPAEEALDRALATLRRHGEVLVAEDRAAQAAFKDHGASMDAFEYRYTGETGLVLAGAVARVLGRVSFFFFERRVAAIGWLKRRRANGDNPPKEKD